VILAYMAHPIAGDVPGNCARARRWLAWLQRTYPDRAFIAPYIDWIEAGDDDSDPVQRELGLQRCCAVAAVCTEFWPVGGRLTEGMRREQRAWSDERESDRPRTDPFRIDHLDEVEPGQIETKTKPAA
jgi:hypothetical protein